jgi:hypothetical protein
VVVAAIGQLQMFAMLGISAVHARIDVFITGPVIGSASYPVHSLVGIVQQGKDTLDSVKGYDNSRVAPVAAATAAASSSASRTWTFHPPQVRPPARSRSAWTSTTATVDGPMTG